jgi:hypothetical protein
MVRCLSLCLGLVLVTAASMSSYAQAPVLAMSDMTGRAAALVTEMEETVERTTQLLARAEREGEDAQTVDFIEERLQSMRGFLDVGSRANARLRAGGMEFEEAQHHYNLVVVSHQRVMALAAQIAQFSGTILRYSGDTELIPNIDERIAAALAWLGAGWEPFFDPVLGAVLPEDTVGL